MQRVAVGTILFAILLSSAFVEGNSDVVFEMTKEDLRAWKVQKGMKHGPPIFSIQELIAKRKNEFDKDSRERARELLGADPPNYATYINNLTYSIEPMSAAGSIISYLESFDGYSPGAAHPYHSTSMVAFDVVTKKKASLLTFYNEKQVVDALKADSWIRKFNVPPASMASIKSLAQLAEALNDAKLQLEDSDSCELDAYFNADMAEDFAFYDVMPDQVAIRIGVPYSTEICRGTFHQIGLLLPVPDSLRGILLRAKEQKMGFFMKTRKSAGGWNYSASWEVDLQELAEKLMHK